MNDEEWFSKFQRENQGSFVEDAVGAIKFGLQKVEDTVETVIDKGAEILEPIVKPVDEFFGITEGKVVGGKQMPSGFETAQSLAEASYDVPYQTAKDLGAPEGVAVAAGVAGSLLEPSPFGEAKAATVAGELLSKAKPIKAAVSSTKGPTQTLQPSFVTFAGNLAFKADPTDNLQTLLNQPLQAATGLTRQPSFAQPVREILKTGSNRQLAAFFRKGPGGKLKGKNLYINADELAANKGGILDRLLEREDRLAQAWERYQKSGSQSAQRNLYDIASKNILDSAELIYGKKGIRKYIQETTNWLTGDEWHHIFGNKEAGEFVLMQAAQDPLVAINIFAKMKEIGLSSSGIAHNLAIMKKFKHVEWHDFMKAEGFEPEVAGRTEALLDFADLSQRVSKQIASGDADVNDIFRMLDAYAGFNKWVREELPKFGAEVIGEMGPGVQQATQMRGYTKAPKPSKPSKTP